MNKEIGKQIADIVCEAWNTLDSSLFEAFRIQRRTVCMYQLYGGCRVFANYIT